MYLGSRRFCWCAETEKGVYFGQVVSGNVVRADKLVRQYLLNLGHTVVHQLRIMDSDGKEPFLMETFNTFVE